MKVGFFVLIILKLIKIINKEAKLLKFKKQK